MSTEAGDSLPGGGMPRRILVVRLSSLGDVVRMTGVLAALKRLYPSAELLVATGRIYAPLLRGDPAIDRLLTARGGSGTRRAAVESWWRLRPFRRAGIDLAIDLQGTERSMLWMRFSGADLKAGRGAGRPDWRVAVAPDYRRGDVAESALILERLGLRVGDCTPRLTTDSAAEAALDDLLAAAGLPRDGFVVVNPFGRWPAKCWPEESYRALLPDLARQIGRPLVLSAERKEAEAARRLLDGLPAGTAVSLAGRLDLPGLAALLRRADLAITGDSGPMHMAAALGTRVVALFGPTWPERAGPVGEGHVVLQARRLPDYHAYRRNEHRSTMAAITVESVLQAARDQLEATQADRGGAPA